MKCINCGISTKGRGQYSFRYLNETVYLCGTHANRVMKFIKTGERDHGNSNNTRDMVKTLS